jgi:hypothetical protein
MASHLPKNSGEVRSQGSDWVTDVRVWLGEEPGSDFSPHTYERGEPHTDEFRSLEPEASRTHEPDSYVYGTPQTQPEHGNEASVSLVLYSQEDLSHVTLQEPSRDMTLVDFPNSASGATAFASWATNSVSWSSAYDSTCHLPILIYVRQAWVVGEMLFA